MRCVWHPNVRRDKSISIDVFAIPPSPVHACSQQSYIAAAQWYNCVFCVGWQCFIIISGSTFFFYFYFFLCLFERLNPNYIYYIINTAMYATSFGSRRLSPYRRPPHGVRFFFLRVHTIRPMSARRLHSIIIYTVDAPCA